MSAIPSFSRRAFLARTATLPGLAALSRHLSGQPTAAPAWPVAVFSKVYQELELDFAATAAVTEEAGFDGIDCPVRPGGQIAPERAADDLPRLAEALAGRGRKILLLTTGIQTPASPHAETILRTARQLGVKYYRLAYWRYAQGRDPARQLADIKAQLKDLAALNHSLGVCAVLQNHAGTDNVGAKVWDLYELARAFDPAQIAVAFDIGHALNEARDTWRALFLEGRRHLGVAYVKDFKPGAGFVPLGQGGIAQTDFIRLLQQTRYAAPISYHVEYKWAVGARKTRAALIDALRQDLRVWRQWLAA